MAPSKEQSPSAVVVVAVVYFVPRLLLFFFLIYGNRKLKGLNCAQQFARDPGSPMKVTPSVVPFMAVA